MISYAQNFEDVMLWRALKHIENGFYVDVGAYLPDIDSVTKCFYENGWNGINVEPNPEIYQRYVTDRAGDINLQVAVSSQIDTVEMYFVSNPGLSSLNKTIAERHSELGWTTTPSQVSVTTIAEICKQHASGREIHFLKVDIEGFEKQALLGNDWKKYRPWIVVVEATLPMSQVENHDEWEYILLESNYIFAYADGLNRFYVSKEHSELLESFKYPPNVFDGFILASQVYQEQSANEANARATEAEAKAIMSEQSANEANARAIMSEQSANEAWHQYHLIVNSNSWKLTKPLRLIGKAGKWFIRGSIAWLTFSPTSRPRRVTKNVVLKIKNYIVARPALKSKVSNLLDRFPKLKARLKRIGSPSAIQNSKLQIQNLELGNLSPLAKQIYLQLKDAIEQQKASK